MKSLSCENFSQTNRINLKSQSSLFTVIFLLLLVLIILAPDFAFAGTGGSSPFQTMATTIESYTTGPLAYILLTCGVFYAIYLLVTKHTVIPLGMVILAAIVISSSSSVIHGLVSALI